MEEEWYPRQYWQKEDHRECDGSKDAVLQRLKNAEHILVSGQNRLPETHKNTTLPFILANYLRQYLAMTLMLQHHEMSLLLQ